MPLSRRGRRTCAWTGLLALVFSTTAVLGGAPSTAAAPTVVDPSGLWRPTAQKLLPAKDGHRRMVNPSDYRAFTLNAEQMSDRLALAPLEDLSDPSRPEAVSIAVPAPTGELIEFAVVESPIMEDELQAAHPDIRTYAGSSVTDGYAASIRLDTTPFGFHASVRDGQASWYVDPAYLDDTSLYVSYFGASLPEAARLPDEVLDPETGEPLVHGVDEVHSDRAAAPRVGEGPGEVVVQRVYRLALVTDASYAEFFAPGLNTNPLDLPASNAAVLAAKTTLMNRVNQIYSDDLAIKMVLVDNTDLLLNLNNAAREAAAGLAGVGLTGCLPNAIVQNQIAVDTLIGPLNYDIGHIALGVDGGGVAFLGVVGQQGQKAGGCTGLSSPVGDFMAIDYVAHEMGHQFAGPHTFNGTEGNCSGGNRTGGSSVEPGSGSSVMAYAGICAADDLQPHTDPYFSQRTQTEISDYVNSEPADPITDTRGGFEVVTTTNHNPVVTAPADVTIPIRTPFTLNGSATDSDGDPLIYLWEQNDVGADAGVQLTDNTKATGPLFRVFGTFADVSDTDTLLYHSPGQNLATTSPVRTFPDIAQITAGNTNAATGSCPTPVASDYSGAEGTSALKNGPVLDCYSEFLPTAAYLGSGANASPPRLNFRLTARDLTGEGGGTEHDDVTLTVDPTAGPFLVSSQATPTTYDGGSTQRVTWAVNGTAGLAPNVKITMSTDGGATFDQVLVATTPNDGSQDVVIPNIATSQGWIKVEAVDNVFFDLNDAPVTVTPGSVEPQVPETTLISVPGRWNLAETARFSFTSSVAGSTFTCTLDGVSEPCTSPYVATGLAHTTHTFSVAANNGGAVDATPATTSTTVPKAASELKRRTAKWKLTPNRNAYLGEYWRTNKRGQKLTYRVTNARELALVVGKGPNSGKVKVVFQGKTLATISLKGPRASQRVVSLGSFATPVSGRLKVVTLTSKKKSTVRIEGLGVSTGA